MPDHESTSEIRPKVALARHWPLLPIFAVALALRLLVTRGFWIDEITSIIQANTASISETLALIPTVHPPLYHIVLHYWVGLFGISEFAVRAMSIAFGMASVVALYVFANRFFGRNIAIICGIIVAVSPFHVWYSQEARMYSPLFFFATVSLYFFMKLLEERKASSWIGWGVSTILAAYTHYTGGFLFFMEGMYALYYWLLSDGRKEANRPIIQWIIGGVVVIAAVSPLLFFFGDRYGGPGGGLSPSTVQHSFAVAVTTVGEMIFGYHSKDVLVRFGASWPLLIYVVPIALLGYKYIFNSKTKFLTWIALGTTVVLAVAAYAYPMFNPRYLTVMVPAAFLLFARAFVRPNGSVRIAILGVMVTLLSAASLDQALGSKNELRYDNRPAMNFVARSATQLDQVIYTPPYSYMVFNYYYYSPNKSQVFGIPQNDLFDNGTYGDLSPILTRLVAGKQRIFFIYSFRQQDPRVPLVVTRANRFIVERYPYRRISKFSNITVVCYSVAKDCPKPTEANIRSTRSF